MNAVADGYSQKAESTIKPIDNKNKNKQKNTTPINKILYYAPCPVKSCVNRNDCFSFNHCYNKKRCGRFFITAEGFLNCETCKINHQYALFLFTCNKHQAKYSCLEGALHSINVLQSKNNDNKYDKFFKQLRDNVKKQFIQFQGNKTIK